ncbi:amidohydrolase [Staphylococcus massiliensis]|uniref:Amidohydrolase n=1 Tax=Staphylococcus massiliensis S46 TaxID=1229783 RepID=K9ANX3_9STAP|nr:amidohydrolase [Staphylococcus massiliensis]EKU49004.1 amidohydrolase [Staphylococcus massiliensis S46]PNZ99480.1 amidohydrolase [Staphylococcus massiliensis CCUG 55927]
MYDYEQTIEWRRMFHRYPELSDEEYRTTKNIKKILKKFDIKILDFDLETGVVAEVGSGDRMIAIRSDIDALPIHEEVFNTFRSKYDDVMHACGHDIHMASVLSAAVKLKRIEDELQGRVRFVFQPAEELGHGATDMVKANVLEGCEAILGFHNYPSLKVGEFGVKSGILTSNVDRFEFEITGKGAHAARPEDGNDPSIVLGQLITSIQSIVSRNVSAFDRAVVSIGEVTSGKTWNVIPETAYVQGTVRTFDKKVQSYVEKRLKDIATGLETMFDVDIKTTYTHLPGAVYNDYKLTEQSIEVAKETGYDVTIFDEPLTIGEDFSGFTKHYPGVFVMIGSESEYQLHHPKYDPDEGILEKVPDYFVTLAKRLLNQES